MEKLISSKCNLKIMSESYVFPPETRPGDLHIPNCNTIPIINLQDGTTETIVHKVIKASQEFGFFQLINHGVPDKLLSEVLSVAEELFKLPWDDKTDLYSDDSKKSCRLYTSIDYENEKTHYWRDNLRHPCHPLEEHIHSWPEKPTQYREVIANFAREVRKLSLWLLDLISEGLRLDQGFLGDEVTQVMINGKLKSADHRGVTNQRVSRATVGSFIHPCSTCKIKSAKALINHNNPQIYKGFIYKDFLSAYVPHTRDGKSPLHLFQIHNET